VKQKNRPQQNGQSQVEYALLIALVALVGIISLVLLGPQIGDVFSRIMNWSTVEEAAEENPGHIVVRVVDANHLGIGNVRVYAFNAGGRYLGKYGNTDSNGEVAFNEMADGGYKFRADYQSKQFWSPVINWQGQWLAVVETGQRPFTVKVVDAAQAGVNNVRVYAFTAEDRYIGLYSNSDSNGELSFDLSDGSYKFRADYRSNQYWSATVETPATRSTIVETGQQPFTVRVIDAQDNGLDNVRVYAFSEAGNYIGVYGNTNSNGAVTLDIPDGAFKFRADYRSNQYWSPSAQTPAENTAVIQTNEQEVSISVTDGSGSGISNVRVYAFSGSGNYVGIYGNTGSDGVISLPLPEGTFKFRADYRGNQYWSDIIATPGSTRATIETGEGISTIITYDASGVPVANVRVYAFSASGSYTGVYGNTNGAGQVSLALPIGAYKFRADYQGTQYWSGTITTPGNTAVTLSN
jgi:Flp pilus assembly pilin Flp